MSAALSDNRRALIRAMPWVFVLIWSTGFVVARFGMPHSPPFKFLVTRYALSIACFSAWVAFARIWPCMAGVRVGGAATPSALS